MLNLIKHSIFISISLWVLEYVDAVSVLPFFFFPSAVSFPSSPMKDEKGLATRHSVCRYAHLECALPFVLAASGLLKLHGFSSFFVISS
jgi:hypothetical protein